MRIDATELRVAVVGEGANLGVTQAGRIAFARAGGRIDTDAIDNSAGVDTSDHEVNIKILTSALEDQGKLTRAARDKLLQSMTDEVAAHGPGAQPRPDPGAEPDGADRPGGTGEPRPLHGRSGGGRPAGPHGGRPASGPPPWPNWARPARA
ncbi:MAG: NAD-glutamate dehydrogenase domain-containing protein [Caulobacteraceae bacterium]